MMVGANVFSLSRRQHGMALTEMMVGLAIGMIVIAGLFTMFASGNQMFARSELTARIANNQQDLRDVLTAAIRGAGFGLVLPNSAAIRSTQNENLVELSLGTGILETVPVLSGCDDGYAGGLSAPDCGGGTGTAFTVVQEGTDGCMSPPEASLQSPFTGEPVRFTICRIAYAPTQRRLTIESNAWVNGSRSYFAELARDVDDFQLRYTVPDASAAGYTLATASQVTSSNQWGQVSGVEVCYVLRATALDSSSQNQYQDCSNPSQLQTSTGGTIMRSVRMLVPVRARAQGVS